MHNKREVIAVVTLLAVALIMGASYVGYFGNANFREVGSNEKEVYSLTNFGLTDPEQIDCSSLKDNKTSNNYPIIIAYTVSDVFGAREKIRELSKGYGGTLVYDTYNNYPAYGGETSNQENASFTIDFVEIKPEFLSELRDSLNGMDAVETSYNYTGDNSGDMYAYSPYASCVEQFDILKANTHLLGVLARELQNEFDTKFVLYMSQSVSDQKYLVRSNVLTLNSYFLGSRKPQITINLASPIDSSPVPVMY